MEKVDKNGVTVANYCYLSDGTKLSAVNGSGNGLVYSGSLVYNKRGGNLTLESASFTGGRFVATSTGFTPHYFLTDHLGSTRVVVNSLGAVVERGDYYPFGSRWDDGQISDNRYLFNGKEAQMFVDVPYLDYGARPYDPVTGRWFNLDRLAGKYYSISPYAYCAGNPVKFVDPDGKKVVDAKGAILYQNGGWTQAAEGTDAVRVGTSMMKTNIGRNTWDSMVAEEYDITITIDSGIGSKKELGRAETQRDENGEIKDVNITIFEGSINLQVEPQQTGKQAQQLRPLSENDRIGTIGVHEGTHAIDKTPATKDHSPSSAREKKAYEAQERHVRELERQKPIVTNLRAFPNKPL